MIPLDDAPSLRTPSSAPLVRLRPRQPRPGLGLVLLAPRGRLASAASASPPRSRRSWTAALASAVLAGRLGLGKRAAGSEPSAAGGLASPDWHRGVGGGGGGMSHRDSGSFDQRMKAVVLRWGALRLPAVLLRATDRALAAPGLPAEAPGQAPGSAGTVERLRRGHVAAPAGHPGRPRRSVLAARRAARRNLRCRRSRRALAQRRHDAGTERRAA